MIFTSMMESRSGLTPLVAECAGWPPVSRVREIEY